MTGKQLTLPDVPEWRPAEPQPYSPEERVLHVLLQQPGWSVTREEMEQLTALLDRAVRQAIANLREMGWPIVSLTAGYRLASTKEEILEYADREEKRGLTSVRRSRRMRQYAELAA